MAVETRPRILLSADWILKRIQEGKKVRLNNAFIEGDIDISELDLQARRIERTDEMVFFERPRAQKEITLKEDKKIVQSSIKITNSTIQGSLDFSNSIFSGDAEFTGTTFSEKVWFVGAIFYKNARFDRATFSKNARFVGAAFSGDNARFDRATFYGDAKFNRATFGDDAWFNRTTFSGDTKFVGAIFYKNVNFTRATFGDDADFVGVTFGDYAWFNQTTVRGDTEFIGAKFKKNVGLSGSKFEGDMLTFWRATFIKPKSQEEACRKAKNVLAKAGNRDEEEYHFYKEMEAKRIKSGIRNNSGLGLIDCFKTKTWSLWEFLLYDVLEFVFIQKIFGYGVHPWWLMAWWLVIIVLFAGLYYIGGGLSGASGLFDYLKVSFATAIAPGYIAVIINPEANAGYRITTEYFQAVAMIETIVGTFLWAGFIATFAKKYMR